MHFLLYALLPKGTKNVEKALARRMAPYDENNRGLDPDNDDGRRFFYDWYQIGGRYTGRLSGYDPEKDPKNIETCNLCNGTGVRPADQFVTVALMEACGGCNGCCGVGKRVKWPTQWEPHDGDITTCDVALKKWNEQDSNGEQHSPWALLNLQGEYLESPWKMDDFDGKKRKEFDALVKSELEVGKEKGAILVVVDYHS